MINVPSAAAKRLASAVPKFKKVLLAAKERDVNESDTVTIVTDMLEEVFGFDKYSDITREFSIQGTYCDLAVKTAKDVDYLIEVKAIGLALKDSHLKQAVNYASREGIKWVVLTNGLVWQIHRVTLDGRVINEHLCDIDFESINARKDEDAQLLFLLCKRGMIKDNIDRYYEYKQTINKYALGAILRTDTIATIVRREIRKMNPGIKVSAEEIQEMISDEVLKREVIGSEAGIEAHKQVVKFQKSQERAKTRKTSRSRNNKDDSEKGFAETNAESGAQSGTENH